MRFNCGSTSHETYVSFDLSEIIQQLSVVVAGVVSHSKDSGVDWVLSLLMNVQNKWKL